MQNICERVIVATALLTLLWLPHEKVSVAGAAAATTTLTAEQRISTTQATIGETEEEAPTTNSTPTTSAPGSSAATTPSTDTHNCASDYWPRQLDTMYGYVDDVMWPCDDFHEYACGNWRAPYLLRSRGARDTLTAVKADNKQQLLEYLLERQQQLLLAADKHTTLRHSEASAVRLFSTCIERIVDEHDNNNGRVHTNAEASTLHTYTEMLRGISDWPVLNPYWLPAPHNDSLSWGTHLSAEVRRFGVQALWRLLITSNWQQAEQQIFYISAPAFELLKPMRNALRYDSDSEYIYKHYVKYLMLDLGVRVRRAHTIAGEVVEFEKALFELVPSERLVLLREPQTLAALDTQLPELQLRQYFNTVLRDISAELPADYAQRLLVVADVPYLRKLSALLKRTSPELVAKYLLVQFLAHFEVRLHEEDSFQEQREHCLQQLHEFLPAELTEIFMRLQYAHVDAGAYMAQTQTKLNEIFTQLKLEFERALNATNVFERDAQTKLLGLEKLRAMRLLLPQATANSKDQLPSNIVLSADNYDANLLTLWHWRTHKELKEVLETLLTGRSTPRAYNNYGPLDVNAYYRLKQNVIELPVGILRAPFYHNCLDPAKVYGSFVYIIAHELMHGFDYDGINYDQDGNVAGNWGAKAIIRFGSKARCYLTERYEDGEVTLNESIADTEGLRLALETYRRVAAVGVGANATLTTAQLKLFFLSYAQTWCGQSATADKSLHDAHSLRVNNVVSNFVEFAEAYGCGKHSVMNPANKCSIWSEE